jgi:hypothetical protein
VVEVETDSSDEFDDDIGNEICSEHSNEIVCNNDKNKGRNTSTDSRSRVSSSGSIQGVSKCVMCGKEFQHLANLRIHIQSHLGTKAQLKSCDKCDR